MIKSILKYQNSLLLVFFLTIYSLSVGSNPILGDSLAFSVTATKGFDLETNATNHFLYINFLALMRKLFVFLNPHYLFDGISIFFSILTLFFLRKLLKLFDISNSNISLTILLFGFSFTFWRISIITEVYAFYLCFVVLFLYHNFKFVKSKKMIDFYLSSFLLGIMFTIHIQTILFIPFYLYVNYKIIKEKVFFGVLIVLSLFSVLLIPVIEGKQSLISIFTDDVYHESFFNIDLKTITKSFIRNLSFLFYNFIFFIFFAFKGFKDTYYKKYLLILTIPYIVFILKHDVSDTYVFHLVPYILLLILIGKGIEKLSYKIKFIPLFFMIPVVYLASYNLVNYTNYGQQINQKKGFKGGTKYIFYPPLNYNPQINDFIIEYNTNKLESHSPVEKKELNRQYNLSLEWEKMSKTNFK